jgi:HPt (histidine-containing phosphotransfer) domain-containing protein
MSIDYQAAMSRLAGNRALFRKLIAIFDEDSPSLVQGIRDAIAREDRAEVSQKAHVLKGLISNFGAPDAVEAALAVERLALENADTTELSMAMDRLAASIDAASEELDEYRRLSND